MAFAGGVFPCKNVLVVSVEKSQPALAFTMLELKSLTNNVLVILQDKCFIVTENVSSPFGFL